MAAQEFRHCSQKVEENVAYYIQRLKKTFWAAYGREPITQETRNALLFRQLHDLRGPSLPPHGDTSSV